MVGQLVGWGWSFCAETRAGVSICELGGDRAGGRGGAGRGAPMIGLASKGWGCRGVKNHGREITDPPLIAFKGPPVWGTHTPRIRVFEVAAV